MMAAEWSKALLSVMRSGNVCIGSRQTLNAIRKGEAKLVVLASNCPAEVKKAVIESGVKIVEFPGMGVDLGTLCGKPFSVAALAILDEKSAEVFAEVA